MKKATRCFSRLFIAVIAITFYSSAYCLDENQLLNLSGRDDINKILNKLGAPNSQNFPITFKFNSYELKIEVAKNPEQLIRIHFNPVLPFNPSKKDLFVEIKNQTDKDQINDEIIISDPLNGRVIFLTHDLKVSRLELLRPWNTKEKRYTLNEIIENKIKNSNQLIKK